MVTINDMDLITTSGIDGLTLSEERLLYYLIDKGTISKSISCYKINYKTITALIYPQKAIILDANKYSITGSQVRWFYDKCKRTMNNQDNFSKAQESLKKITLDNEIDK